MEKFSTARTAQILDISTETLKRWYKWYEDEKWEKPTGLKLPTPERDNRNTMFFTMQQVQELVAFRDRLNSDLRGCGIGVYVAGGPSTLGKRNFLAY